MDMDMEGQTAESPGSQPTAPNLLQRVIMVIVSPVKLGETLRSQSPWLVTLAIVAVISMALLAFYPEELTRQLLERGSGGRGDQPGLSIELMRWIIAIQALVFAFIVAAIIAGLLYLIFNVIFGQADLTYKQHLSALAHSWWILVLGAVIVFPLKIVQGDALLDLGLGLLLADEPSSFAGFFVNGITIFGLWTAVALGSVESGLSGGKISLGKAGSALIVLYLLGRAVGASFQSLFAG